MGGLIFGGVIFGGLRYAIAYAIMGSLENLHFLHVLVFYRGSQGGGVGGARLPFSCSDNQNSNLTSVIL